MHGCAQGCDVKEIFSGGSLVPAEGNVEWLSAEREEEHRRGLSSPQMSFAAYLFLLASVTK